MLSDDALTPWRPLVDGDERARALTVAREVCEEAAARWVDASPHPTLLGQAAYALLFHYAWRAGIGDWRAQSDACIERACAAVAGVGLGTSLFGGFPGIAWVIQHVSGAPPEEGDALEDVDQLLCEHVARAPFPGTSEELFGIGMYALERMPSPAARRMLEHIVARLAEMADRFADGVAWTTRSEGRTVHSLGAAHGVPGILAFLGGAAAWRIAGAEPLLAEGSAWLWNQRDPNAAIQFSYWLEDGRPANRRWPSWCTGDPGVAGAMLAAGGSSADRARAVELGLRAIAWTPARCAALAGDELLRWLGDPELVPAWTGNPFLCHGAAGRLHIYVRMWQATGDERFARAAREWLAETLGLRRPGRRCAGFSRGLGDGMDWAETGLVYGAAGVALALLAAASSVEPRWDRLLMLSVARENPAA
ncbi:MAG TPA: lanthionine synthetase LanC family protein [Haliangiales bacterium]|nr:lanthionine synthetase LanC family protein [Haliangiales bacterium]